jgi:hypothetical protein
MNRHVNVLRELCDRPEGAPFLIRTRVERHLFGLLNATMRDRLRLIPVSISRSSIESQIGPSACRDRSAGALALEIGHVFEKFTYLCDTSNWSNDGQDPRIESCREDILRLCDRFESQGPI